MTLLKMLPVAALLVLAAAATVRAQMPAIPFAPLVDKSLKDPDNPAKVFRPDLAKVERDFPLTPANLATITPANLKEMSQEQVDQVYGRLTAGPIPDGRYRGDLFLPRGDSLDTRLAEILGGIDGRLGTLAVETIEALARSLWKGKTFDRETRILRNYIDDRLLIRALVGDTSSIQKTVIPRTSFLRTFLPGNDVFLLFPAKLYCGQSLLDGRRESVIIDYAYNDDLPGYRANPDSLANRNGLAVRDEIRMVRPGFYLGRAYLNRVFLLNFTLINDDVVARDGPAFQRTGEIAEDCWPGEQQRTAAN